MGFKIWDNSPLMLNITIIISLVLIIFTSLIYILDWMRKRRKRMEEKLESNIISSKNKDFDPKDDTDPNRAIAILKIPVDESRSVIAGNVELLSKLPHITPEVYMTFNTAERIDLFQVTDN